MNEDFLYGMEIPKLHPANVPTTQNMMILIDHKIQQELAHDSLTLFLDRWQSLGADVVHNINVGV